MKLKNAFLLALFVSAGALLSACADPCGDLEDQCGDCPGTDAASMAVETACNIIVSADDSDACDAALDLAAYKCP